VLELVARHRALRAENETLREQVAERDARLRELGERRQDALQRIDALVAQIDELDAKLEASETAV
jgi:peptidoglycan hydrolase CwlO-like protein